MFDDLLDEEPADDSDPLAPFEMPAGLPQMEGDRNKSIKDLMFEAPAWDAAWTPELLVLLRNHVALRSALGLSMEIAKIAENSLRHETKNKVLMNLQGQVQGLERYYTVIMDALVKAEAATKQSVDDEQEQD